MPRIQKVVRKPVEDRKRVMPPGIVNTSVKFPEELHKALRVEAAQRGDLFNTVVIEHIQGSVRRRQSRAAKRDGNSGQ